MNVEKAKERYWDQLNAAVNRRGIEWGFTFETWVGWWEKQLGPNWLSKRGRGRNKYQMARKGDKGPYTPWNVECITGSQNSRDKVKNGTQVHGVRSNCSKLTEQQVTEIFCANACIKELCVRYKASYDVVWGIRQRVTWRRTTEGLKLGSGCQCGIRGTRCAKGFTRRYLLQQFVQTAP